MFGDGTRQEDSEKIPVHTKIRQTRSAPRRNRPQGWQSTVDPYLSSIVKRAIRAAYYGRSSILRQYRSTRCHIGSHIPRLNGAVLQLMLAILARRAPMILFRSSTSTEKVCRQQPSTICTFKVTKPYGYTGAVDPTAVPDAS